MIKIHEKYEKKPMRPEKILMFGEGNFLRAFIGKIVDSCNNVCAYNGSIVALQGVVNGMSDSINAQDGLYTLIERGFLNNEPVLSSTVIDCLSRCIDPYRDYDAFLQTASNADIQVIISNTTEFGICFDEAESASRPHKNFPAKLTDWLYERFITLGANGGVLILPCELIDKNADALLKYVLKYAKEWELESEFINWVQTECKFCNTLVDRVVSGYPFAESKKMADYLGYEDSLIDVCEPFLLWVINSAQSIDRYLPVSNCGLNIIVTSNLESYRIRKVRILNGAHTSSVLAGYLCGFETVDEIISNEVFYNFISQAVKNEIIPSFVGQNLHEYAEGVFERFRNPFLKHRLANIALNSISKFKVRVLGSICDCIKKGIKPEKLLFSLAALINFYEREENGAVSDEEKYLSRINKYLHSGANRQIILNQILSDRVLWDEDLTKLPYIYEYVVKYDDEINKKGVYESIKSLIGGNNESTVIECCR